ncbi:MULTISPECIES: RNA polymerase sigma factor [unclassified Sphingobacterium]|uniref:RNA polymerase sigma factor n=1 Tax=unclassified Sphingobacterium TaxID=2609468 RepID=UPI00143CB03F|nr:RNA polymerase sigma-70 factor [Sphingobacterium sp. B16(2022)]NJI71998.1 RNA polymerase sigma-70 factor [Sphingobacterium sp. B16(2022)]
MQPVEERKRVKELIEGNTEAFEDLYHRYRPLIYTAIFKLIKSHELSQEIFQDVFVRIWNQRDRLDPDKSFKSYLYMIAQNLVYDHLRQLTANRKKLDTFKTYYLKTSGNDTENALDLKETQAYLDKILEQVPEKCRQVYILCKLEGRSYEDVSKLLNISIATVNSHIVKASRIIKKNWKSDYYTLILFFYIFK